MNAESFPEGVALDRKPRWVPVAAVLMLLIHAGLLAWIGARNSPTLDEVGHLPAGLSHWQFANFDLYHVNPPLVRMVATIPLLFARPVTDWSGFNPGPWERSEFAIGTAFLYANGSDSFWYFMLAHWACISLSLLGGYFCFRWGRELYGDRAGLMALALWCFSPNVLGNAAMITPDAGAAALGIGAGYAFWRWLQRKDWPSALLAGLMLGLAELTKTTWIILFGLWPLLWFLDALASSRGRDWREWRRQALQLAAILLLAVYAINVGYGFEGTFTPLEDFEFVSQTLNGQTEPRAVGNRFDDTALGEVPIPLPRNYVRGIDMQKSDFERRKWSYLRGELKLGGWWYYYLYAIGVKVPLGTLLCVGLAIVCAVLGWGAPRRWRHELVVLAPCVAVLVLVSSQTGFNRYLRYLLPAFPFAFVWLGQIAEEVDLRSRWVARVAVLLLSFSIISSLSVVPHSLSYFNELAGGPERGPEHLLDANIDWGQDLLHLKGWYDDHPDARPLHLAYFGFVHPQLAGLEFETTPPGLIPGEETEHNLLELGPQPGWYAVSVNHVYGYTHWDEDKPYYAYFRHFTPVDRVGYTILIYHITADDANAVRHKLGMPPLARHVSTFAQRGL